MQEQFVYRGLHSYGIVNVHRAVFGKTFGAGNFFRSIVALGEIRRDFCFNLRNFFLGKFYGLVQPCLYLFKNRRDGRRGIAQKVERHAGNQLCPGGCAETQHY